MMNPFRIFLILAAAISLGSLLSAKPLNFINIMVDDMGYSDIGCMGGPVETPHLDSLADGGILFTNYRTYPKCFPTRDAILTGMDAPPIRTPEDGITIGEALKTGGYSTYFVGKTHGAVMDNFTVVPKRGFDRSFGNEDGGNYWLHTLKQTMLDGEPWHTDQPFYKTDVHTDFSLQFLDEHDPSKPFFLHLAYHSPHFPIQAKEEDIQKYVGQFMEGPAALRKKRFARMKAMGLIPDGTQLSPGLKRMDTIWEQLSPEDKALYDLVMAGYCAMIDNVDQNIGRVLKKLEELGITENTVIFFSSDNGGCAEGASGEGRMWPKHQDSRFGMNYDINAKFGSKDSHWKVGPAWTNLSNTPFRYWKNMCHEGGLAVPFIVNAPSVIKKTGEINRAPIMVMDVMPTVMDLAEVSYPDQFEGRPLKPMRGESFRKILEGSSVEFQRPMHFFYAQTTTFIEYPWKIVSVDNTNFELYNLEGDRSELDDLAATMPERLEAMTQRMMDYREGRGLKKARKKKE